VLEDGSRGLVVKSGHGFYSVDLDNNAGRVLKRVIDLRLERDVDGLPSGKDLVSCGVCVHLRAFVCGVHVLGGVCGVWYVRVLGAWIVRGVVWCVVWFVVWFVVWGVLWFAVWGFLCGVSVWGVVWGAPGLDLAP
jgi:hypothetical protein